MVRLTREVRFGIHLDGSVSEDGKNGFAGGPALGGLGVFLFLRVTVQGEPDARSGYLLNIKDIDREVRKRVVPALREIVAKAQVASAETLVLRCADLLRDAWMPVEVVEIELCLSPFLSSAWSASEPQMVRLSQKFEFSAAHRLNSSDLSHEENVATFGKCNNPYGHGHNYEVQVTVAGVPDAKTGQLISVAELEKIVEQHVIEAYDHKHLNVEVPDFFKVNPSVENIARAIYRRLAPALDRTAAKLATITVWETPKTWAEYSEG